MVQRDILKVNSLCSFLFIWHLSECRDIKFEDYQCIAAFFLERAFSKFEFEEVRKLAAELCGRIHPQVLSLHSHLLILLTDVMCGQNCFYHRQQYHRSTALVAQCLYGGAPKAPQLKEIKRGVDIVNATPGRLNDILEMKRFSLHQISYLVLDEADRMLDMVFELQIRKIVNEVPTKRQTLMYTATWPKEVRIIAVDLLANPAQVNIGNVVWILCGTLLDDGCMV